MDTKRAKPKSVLIIDDEQSIREVLVTYFEQQGYDVLTASDGRDGIAQFKSRPTNLVITDIVMPRVEGIETIRKIRKQSKSVKIIAMTGYVDAYLREAITLGADDSIVKPFDSEQLNQVLHRVMGPNQD
ncbi:MAG: response regulator [Candidatus Marinimicrobia bacterium]|nr:response regulator [Candidatus Neomarinimicrobiota bacterium]